MTTEVTTTQGSNLPANTGGVPEGFDASDISIPYLSLVQASSEAVKQRKAQPGAFLSSDGATADFLDFVPLHIQPVRDFYDRDGQKNICSSNDRTTGYPKDLDFFRNEGNIDLAEGDTLACAQCPFANGPVGPKLGCYKGYV